VGLELSSSCSESEVSDEEMSMMVVDSGTRDLREPDFRGVRVDMEEDGGSTACDALPDPDFRGEKSLMNSKVNPTV
jgi:hypothetical protein